MLLYKRNCLVFPVILQPFAPAMLPSPLNHPIQSGRVATLANPFYFVERIPTQYPVFQTMGKKNLASPINMGEVRQLSKTFLQRLPHRTEDSIESIQGIFKRVHQLQASQAFETNIQQETGRSVCDLLQQHFQKNRFQQVLLKGPYLDMVHQWKTGDESPQATPWQYRLYGFRRSVDNFVSVCKKHPIASTGVIGAVSVSGYFWPFWGGLSGALILGWSFVEMLVDEWKASQLLNVSLDRREALERSGENLAAFAITMVGADGIWKHVMHGVQSFEKTYAGLKHASQASRVFKALKQAFISKTTLPSSFFESVRFVSGLLDNVLMPFNELANLFRHQEAGHFNQEM